MSVTTATLPTILVKEATQVIPIVFVAAGDPTGLVASLARPGGNATGLSNQTGFRAGLRDKRVVWRRVPRNTPAVIIDSLNKEINAGFADPRLKGRFADLGATVFPGSPADFGKLIAEETEKWAKVVKFAGIKAD
jgi:Tripartite tricarboxylate transporter family receptor/ABC transporter substrate binding protein